MDIKKTLEQIESLRKQLNRLEKLAIEQETKKRLEALKKEPKVRVHTITIEVRNRPSLPYYPDVRPYRTVSTGTPLSENCFRITSHKVVPMGTPLGRLRRDMFDYIEVPHFKYYYVN